MSIMKGRLPPIGGSRSLLARSVSGSEHRGRQGGVRGTGGMYLQWRRAHGAVHRAGSHSSREDAAGNILVDGAKTSLTVPVMHDLGRRDHRQHDPDQRQRHTRVYADGRRRHDLTYLPTGTTANWGSINWTVNLGDNSALPVGGDQFTVDNSVTPTTDHDRLGRQRRRPDRRREPGRRAGGCREGDRLRLDRHGTGHWLERRRHRQCRRLDRHGGARSRRDITIDGSSSATTYQYLTGGAGNDTITGSGAAYTTIAGGLGND